MRYFRNKAYHRDWFKLCKFVNKYSGDWIVHADSLNLKENVISQILYYRNVDDKKLRSTAQFVHFIRPHRLLDPAKEVGNVGIDARYFGLGALDAEVGEANHVEH